jgi:peptide/nickel transport system substrate-binding protein
MRKVLIFAAAGAVALIALTSGSASARPVALPVLRVGAILPNFAAVPAVQGWEASSTYASWIVANYNGTFSPGVAQSWGYVNGTNVGANKVFQLRLRHNVRYADGSLVTAATAKSALEYEWVHNGLFNSTVGKLNNIQALGKWRVRITIRSPNPVLPYVFSDAAGGGTGIVISPEALHNWNVGYFATHTDGAGPYVMAPSESVANDHYTLVPNKYYWDQSAIHYNKIVVTSFQTSSDALAALQTGQIDLDLGSDLPGAERAQAAGLKVISTPVKTVQLTLNTDLGGEIQPALKDVRVRQALNYALDRTAISKTLFGKYGSPTSEWFSTDGQNVKYTNYYSYNPSKAKTLLAAAGYPDGFTMNVYAFNEPIDPELAQLVANYWHAIGVKVNLQEDTDFSHYYASSAWACACGAAAPTVLGYGRYFVGAPGSRSASFFDPTLNQLYLRAIRAPARKAAGLYQQMAAREVTQALDVPVAVAANFFLMSKRVSGLTASFRNPVPSVWQTSIHG